MIYQDKVEQLTTELQALKAELALSQARCEQYAQAYDSLKDQIIELRRHRFGKRSERYIDPEHPQLSLFEDNDQTFSQAETEGESLSEEMTQIAAHKRKKNQKQKKNYLVALKLFHCLMKTKNVLVAHVKQSFAMKPKNYSIINLVLSKLLNNVVKLLHVQKVVIIKL